RALRSPPYTPSYNGACEAGVGSIKRGAEQSAREGGRPGQWTLDDLEAARLFANEFGRPRRANQSPDEAWRARMRISAEERDAFAATYRLARLREERRRSSEEDLADPRRLARIERAAVSAALAELQYLKIRRD
ncbi:hypothetical protein DRQ32_11130, partial [bacterium]